MSTTLKAVLELLVPYSDTPVSWKCFFFTLLLGFVVLRYLWNLFGMQPLMPQFLNSLHRRIDKWNKEEDELGDELDRMGVTSENITKKDYYEAWDRIEARKQENDSENQ